MTHEEKLIVSAYTGYLMSTYDDYHTFVEKLLGRPILTHELASKEIHEEIREKVKPQFVALCDKKPNR